MGRAILNQVKPFLKLPGPSGYVRFDPDDDSVRNEPWFQAILAEADGKK